MTKFCSYKKGVFLFLKYAYSIVTLMWLAIWNGVVFADESRPAPSALALARQAICNISGECTIDVSSTASNILQSCEEPKASVMWNRQRQGAFFVACDCECTSHDNIGWIIDMMSKMESRKIQKVQIGKLATIDYLKQEPTSISDMISSHPLCEKIDVEKLKASIFVTLIKQPTNNETSPYCFFPAYVIEGGANLEIKTNNVDDAYGELLRVDGDDPIFEDRLVRYLESLPR